MLRGILVFLGVIFLVLAFEKLRPKTYFIDIEKVRKISEEYVQQKELKDPEEIKAELEELKLKLEKILKKFKAFKHKVIVCEIKLAPKGAINITDKVLEAMLKNRKS